MSFIDENCIIFDNDDENKFEYTTLHEVSGVMQKDESWFCIGFQENSGWATMWANGWTRDHTGAVPGRLWKGIEWPETQEDSQPNHGSRKLPRIQAADDKEEYWT